MATNNLTQFLTEIADAIRYCRNSNDPINPQDFVKYIMLIAEKSVGTMSSDNTISLSYSILEKNDTYSLYYENAAGRRLDNFEIICTLTVSGKDVSWSDFINVNIPPYLAEKIGVYDSSDNRMGYISIANFKPDFGDRLYRVGLLSDVHDYEGSQAEASDDFCTALRMFNDKEDVVMTCISGDISENGTASEFQTYKTDVETQSPNTPVYTTSGNHDCGNSNSTINASVWEQYTGTPITFERSYTLPNGKVDHYLFLGMTKYSLGSSGTPYSNADLTWLSEKLSEYRNDRCFVFTHLFFPDRAGNLNKIYPSANWLGGSQLTTLQNLCDTYVNSIWFSGHSHWKWYLQKYQDIANIYRAYDSSNAPTCGWCVHLPSCASPIDSDGSSRVSMPLEAEGGVMDVYENYVDIRGINLKNEKYLPIATYRLDTTLQKYAAWKTVTADNFIQKPKASGETLNNNKDVNGSTSTNPKATYDASSNVLTVTFDNGNQKMLFQDSSITSSTAIEDIAFTYDDVQFYVNGTNVTNNSTYTNLLKELGFYCTDGEYSLVLPGATAHAQYPQSIKISAWGSATTYYAVQFNCSNSGYLNAGKSAGLTNEQLFPLEIRLTNARLKVKLPGEKDV